MSFLGISRGSQKKTFSSTSCRGDGEREWRRSVGKEDKRSTRDESRSMRDAWNVDDGLHKMQKPRQKKPASLRWTSATGTSPVGWRWTTGRTKDGENAEVKDRAWDLSSGKKGRRGWHWRACLVWIDLMRRMLANRVEIQTTGNLRYSFSFYFLSTLSICPYAIWRRGSRFSIASVCTSSLWDAISYDTRNLFRLTGSIKTPRWVDDRAFNIFPMPCRELDLTGTK